MMSIFMTHTATECPDLRQPGLAQSPTFLGRVKEGLRRTSWFHAFPYLVHRHFKRPQSFHRPQHQQLIALLKLGLP
jgi:hypothetical protein